ncbi:hypothetical protein NBRC111894_1987 [Sporolactobacillus inulinus]|uniref:Uncharacterized protein n=1 Tax=Sporolactobacillus inulinus TaxID=2078 RepID=A0A4Y1ZBW7_9BACL|nr:hypothetical protein NBRC111894_1987 [Sporolactobacillus inulinus]
MQIVINNRMVPFYQILTGRSHISLKLKGQGLKKAVFSLKSR